MENQHLPRNVTKSLQTILHTPYKYWAPEITKKNRGDIMILKTRAFSIVGSAYRLIGYPRVGYGCVGYPLVTYGSVGKGSLSFRGVSDMSYLPHMSELPHYVPLCTGLHSSAPFVPFCLICPYCPYLSYLPYSPPLSVLSVPGLYSNKCSIITFL